MSLSLDRGLSLIECLAGQPEGMALSDLADELLLPHSACHRLLNQLLTRGYVRQAQPQGPYLLTTKVCALGLAFLSSVGIVDIAEPLMERLAQHSGELVRLALIDEDRLTWVAKAQGSRKGVRYDPDMGADARLSCTASGHAWLMTLSDERALQLVSQQGFGAPKDYGPNAPTTIKALLAMLETARTNGFAMIDEVFAPGMSALAAPVLRRQQALGIISIAGPRTRLTVQRMQSLAPLLLAATAELGPMSHGSAMYGRPPLGKA